MAGLLALEFSYVMLRLLAMKYGWFCHLEQANSCISYKAKQFSMHALLPQHFLWCPQLTCITLWRMCSIYVMPTIPVCLKQQH